MQQIIYSIWLSSIAIPALIFGSGLHLVKLSPFESYSALLCSWYHYFIKQDMKDV